MHKNNEKTCKFRTNQEIVEIYAKAKNIFVLTFFSWRGPHVARLVLLSWV